MNEYIFYTDKGFTQDPQGCDIENCQLMGRAFGTDSQNALNNLISENPWIKQHGFDPNDFLCEKLASDNNA